MSSSVKFLAFLLFPCFILVSCAPPEHVYHSPTRPAEATAGNVVGNQQPQIKHGEVSPVKIPALSENNESINKTDASVDKTGTDHASVTIKTVQPTVTPTPKSAHPGKDPAPNAASAGQHVKTVTISTTVASLNDTFSSPPPHHKKAHTSTVPPHSDSAHPHIAVPISEFPKSENVIEDVANPAPRPLRAAEKFNPTFGAIVAAICITTAVGGYVILMAWRKIEMDRYGNRQMLINEDDFGDIQDEDMRHFEASCIQIDA